MGASGVCRSRVRGYKLEKYNTRSGSWEKVGVTVPKDDCSVVVPKLKEGQDYKFRVVAENAEGDSESLETARPITAKNPFGEQEGGREGGGGVGRGGRGKSPGEAVIEETTVVQ